MMMIYKFLTNNLFNSCTLQCLIVNVIYSLQNGYDLLIIPFEGYCRKYNKRYNVDVRLTTFV